MSTASLSLQHVAASVSPAISRRRHAKKLGIYVFGGSGTGTLRIHLDDGKTALILANLDGCYYDGGDGGCRPDEDGLLRGE